jgi:zinc protease
MGFSLHRMHLLEIGLVALVLAAGCGETSPQIKAPAPVVPPPPPVVIQDPLGPAPRVSPPTPYAPPVPEVWKTPNGITVWLIERHSLPYVAMTLTLPTGSSSDPKGKGGLAYATADMLDEGAGTRGAIELSRAIDALGATLVTGATLDTSEVSLSVLKKNLAQAFGLFADVVARPRFEPAEWRRVHDLETNDLLERAADPEEVERVVTRAVLFGADHPYGHPVDGTVATTGTLGLADVTGFYRAAFRPDRAFIAVLGDTNRTDLTALLEQNLGSWKNPASTPAALVTPPPPKGPWPKLVLVDRADAPQAVVALARPGVEVSNPDEPLLERANLMLGGLFTSRLNQDLREEHGYTYGAGSRLSRTRGVGSFIASASIFTEKTTDGLRALVGDVTEYAKTGMTPEEAEKTRLQSRGDRVETFETYDHAAEHLAVDAALGLGPEYERSSALASEGATRDALAKLGASYFDPASAFVVVVGPRTKLEEPLRALGYGAIELRDADGKPLPNKAR